MDLETFAAWFYSDKVIRTGPAELRTVVAGQLAAAGFPAPDALAAARAEKQKLLPYSEGDPADAPGPAPLAGSPGTGEEHSKSSKKKRKKDEEPA